MLYSLVNKILKAMLDCLFALKEIRQAIKDLHVRQEELTGILLARFDALSDQVASIQEQNAKILAAVTPLPAVGFVFTSNLEGEIIEGATSTTMKNSQKLTLSIQPVDKNGNPAELGSVPAWKINDSTLATLTPTGDGLNCELAGIGPSGTTKVVVSADADLGEGVKPIFGEYELTVTPGDAVGFKITASEPVDQ